MFTGKIVLGSSSPRRKQLVEALGLQCVVRKKEVEEEYPEDLDPYKVPEFLSTLKAKPLIEDLKEDEILLTSDTVVIMNKEIRHKPKNRDEAISMLLELSGNANDVVTGVSLTSHRKAVVFSSVTTVYFNKLRMEDIEYYVDTFKPYDKAGAYGIQEWIGQIGVQKIEGCFYNVLGLPVQQVWEHLHDPDFST